MDNNILKVALIQIHAKEDKEANLEKVSKMIKEACNKYKPHLIALPEVFNFRGKSEDEAKVAEEFPENSESLKMITELAKENNVSIMAGTILEKPKYQSKTAKNEKPLNTCFYVNKEGKLLSKYTKIHLFDVNINNYPKESDKRRSGSFHRSNLKVFEDRFTVNNDIRAVNFGLSICYDLRFPELYRTLMFGAQNQGIPDIIFAPAAFSKGTGPDHWEPLLRARAIENTIFIIAPNQVGDSSGGFGCHGNSMVVNPWGKVLARASDDQEEILYTEINLEEVKEVRKKLPLENARMKSIF